MNISTYIYILLAAIAALLVSLFLYKYKSKSALKHNALFAFLRFLSVFLLLLLLINPKIESTTYYTEKPNLVVVTDNSNSIAQLQEESLTEEVSKVLTSNEALKEKFNISSYNFNDGLDTDSLSFKSRKTNINKAFNDLYEIYKRTVSPTILITDGNQTSGVDYEFSADKYKQNIYPIVVGDTTIFSDIKITTLNVNKYAYLKNKFPVEAIVVYNGNEAINKTFSITANNKVVFTKQINLTKTNNSQVLRFNLPSLKVGVQTYVANISNLENEKNTINNTKNFAIEVIDESTKVAIVSSILHPDIGVLKKAIETNEQRKVVVLNPNELKNQINDFQLVVLFQPNNSFKDVFKVLKKENKNHLTVTGTKTDWNFMNTNSDLLEVEATNQTEDFQANLNSGYSTFIVQDLDFNSFPPLQSTFGDFKFKKDFQTLLYKNVNGIITQEPLLATLEENEKRYGFLLGENLWKWRAQSFINQQSFNNFDDFIGKLVQYLASKRRKERLSLDYNSFYGGTTNATIKAQIFNKNYEFDANASLSIKIKNKETDKVVIQPLILKNNYYETNLDALQPGNYTFTVYSKNDNLSKSGQFRILDYNIEAQFNNSNYQKLNKIAVKSEGEALLLKNYENLITKLINDNRYLPIQKSITTNKALIDWYYLLIIIVLIIAIEWFLRKYRGLI